MYIYIYQVWLKARQVSLIIKMFEDIGSVKKTVFFGTYRVELVIALFSRILGNFRISLFSNCFISWIYMHRGICICIYLYVYVDAWMYIYVYICIDTYIHIIIIDLHNIELIMHVLTPHEVGCCFCRLGWLKVSFIICMLTLLLMPLAGLHFCVVLDFVTPLL
jgi:hypothetical protein